MFLFLTTQWCRVRDEHFYVSQSNVKTLSGVLENVYMILQQVHPENGVPNLSKLPKFYTRYYNFGLFSRHTVQ